MGQFIRALHEDGRLRLYVDYRTGSYQDLSAYSHTSSFVGSGTGKWQNTRKGKGLYISNTGLVQTFAAALSLEFPSTGLLLVCMASNLHGTPANSVFFGTPPWTSFYFYVSSTSLATYNGSASCLASPVTTKMYNNSSVAALLVSGSPTRFFVDGAVVTNSVSNAQTWASSAQEVRINQSATRPNHASLMIDADGITDADIARLHRELVAGPSVVRRPRKGFSLPYPSKTPSEYAAEGIILDMEPVVGSGGQVPNHAGTPGTITAGAIDVSRKGPFTTSFRFDKSGYVTGTAVCAAPTSFSCSFWVEVDSTTALSNQNLLSIGLLLFRFDNALANFWSDVAGTPQSWVGYLLPKKPTHVALVKVNGQNARLFIDSVEHSVSAGPAVDLAVGANPTWRIGAYGGSPTTRFWGEVASGKVQVAALTPAEVRAEYLRGATKCLLDARVHSDGSCPVSLAAVGAPNEIANGWQVQSGTHKVIEAAPANGRPGARSIQCVTAGVVWTQANFAAYGAWYFKASVASLQTTFLNFLSDRVAGSNAPVGYALILGSAGELYLRRNVGGGHVNIFGTATGVLTAGVEYEFWITRRVDGQFSVWLKGGTYADWTLVPTTSGSNPVTDTTYTQSLPYLVADLDAGSTIAAVTHYLSEFNPFEAIRAGKLSGTIPEPFWEVTTTDTTQNWTMNLAAGAVYVFEWGDGTSNWYTGTGVNQAITHTYASAGTYVIRGYCAPTSLLLLYCTANDLIGAPPTLSGATSLSRYYFNDNPAFTQLPDLGSKPALLVVYGYNSGFVGTLPSFTGCTALVEAHYFGNVITGYAPSVIAATCTTFDMHDNALTLAAVDQILIDFTTGAAGRPAAGTINLSGGTNATPTPAIKAAAQTALPGWTITVNS